MNRERQKSSPAHRTEIRFDFDEELMQPSEKMDRSDN
jgi:hypothetical protein